MEKYFSEIINGIAALLQGMSLTLRTMFGVLGSNEATTVQYPEEKLDLSYTYGYVQAQFDDEGYSKCTTCMGCIRACPVGCITLERGVHPENEKRKIAKIYRLDYSKCEFCNLCVEACNDDAIVMAPIHEFPLFDRSVMHVTLVRDMKKGDDLVELSNAQQENMKKRMKTL